MVRALFGQRTGYAAAWTHRPVDIAAILAAVGGLLILAESLAISSWAGTELVVPFGTIAGLSIAGLGLALMRTAQHRRELGGVIVILSILSFLGVSGYYLGALLGLIGGAITLTSYGRGLAGPRSTSRPNFALGPPCQRCGHPVPTWAARCPYCGFPE